MGLVIMIWVLLPSIALAQTPRTNRDDGAPKVGDVAPLFALKTLDGSREVDLTRLVGSRPIVLLLGSYT